MTAMANALLGFFTFSPMEMAFILMVALLLFGRRLPEVARSMGRSIQEFKKGLNDAQRDLHSDALTSEPIRPAIEARPEPAQPVQPAQPTAVQPAQPTAVQSAQQQPTESK